MTPEQIEEMKRDREAGTPGPWVSTAESRANVRRCTRVPDMEVHILAQQAEIDRLRQTASKELRRLETYFDLDGEELALLPHNDRADCKRQLCLIRHALNAIKAED